MTLLSIVVPIRDMGGVLRPLFEWVETALRLNCQVVLVHDYLDPKTEDDLLAFVKGNKSKNLQFVSATFNSPGLARNAGLNRTIGEYVAFWDADDFPEVKKIIDIAQRCRDEKYEIGIGGFQTINSQRDTLKSYSTSFQDNLIKVALYPGVWRMVFRSSILKKAEFTNLLLAEDQLFLATLLPADKKVLFCDEIIYIYTLQREGALSTKRTNTSDLIRAIKLLSTQIDEGISSASTKFNTVLIIRNCITALRIGTNQQRFQALKYARRILSRYPISTIHTLFIIMRFKKVEKWI